ncbi:hypothetical protein RA808_003484 [Vibrio cholerae]|nr:hypothetical protein [Vibrio cholerae]
MTRIEARTNKLCAGVALIMSLAENNYALSSPLVEFGKVNGQTIVKRLNVDPWWFNTSGRPRNSIYDTSVHILRFTGPGTQPWTVGCRTSRIGPISSRELPSNPANPKRLRYMEQAAADLNNCSPWVTREGKYSAKLNNVSIDYNDGHTYGDFYSRWASPMTPINFRPVECDAQISKQMGFGTLKSNSDLQPTANGAITITCNRDLSVKYSVNNGSVLTTSDGSVISFKYSSVNDVEADRPKELNVTGIMTTLPTSPGAYQWYVPVLVTYD